MSATTKYEVRTYAGSSKHRTLHGAGRAYDRLSHYERSGPGPAELQARVIAIQGDDETTVTSDAVDAWRESR